MGQNRQIKTPKPDKSIPPDHGIASKTSKNSGERVQELVHPLGSTASERIDWLGVVLSARRESTEGSETSVDGRNID